MKKYLSILVAVVLLSFVSMPMAFAQTNDNATTSIDDTSNMQDLQSNSAPSSDTIAPTPDTIQAQKDQLINEMETAKNAILEKMEAFKTKMEVGKNKLKVAEGVARINDREDALAKFDNVVAKLGILKDNVNTKIVKFQAQGLDVTGAQAQVDIATEKITEVQGKVADVDTLLSNSANELSKDDQATFKQLTLDIETLAEDAHLALNQAVLSLEQEMQNKINATDANDATSQ